MLVSGHNSMLVSQHPILHIKTDLLDYENVSSKFEKKSDVKATANLKDEPALSRGFCHIFAQTSLMADCRSLKKDNRLNLHFWLPQMPFQKIAHTSILFQSLKVKTRNLRNSHLICCSF